MFREMSYVRKIRGGKDPRIIKCLMDRENIVQQATGNLGPMHSPDSEIAILRNPFIQNHLKQSIRPVIKN